MPDSTLCTHLGSLAIRGFSLSAFDLIPFNFIREELVPGSTSSPTVSNRRAKQSLELTPGL